MVDHITYPPCGSYNFSMFGKLVGLKEKCIVLRPLSTCLLQLKTFFRKMCFQIYKVFINMYLRLYINKLFQEIFYRRIKKWLRVVYSVIAFFFFFFSISENNFLFLRLNNLFGNPKWTVNKNYSQNLICKGN